MNKLVAYPWPGNVRELQNVLKRILVLGDWEKMVDELVFGPNVTGALYSGDPQSKKSSIISERFDFD